MKKKLIYKRKPFLIQTLFLSSTIFLYTYFFQPYPSQARSSLSSKIEKENTVYQIAKAKKRRLKSRKKNRRTYKRKTTRRQIKRQLNHLYSLYKNKRYKEVSEKAFRLIVHPGFKPYKNSLRFLLGSSLYNLKFYQAASFQFASVVKETKNENLITKNITNLYLAANQLDDQALIRFAISKINLADFPKKHKDLLYLRIGEKYLENRDFKRAIKILKTIPRKSSVYLKSKYLLALAYSELKKNRSALRSFYELFLSRNESPKNDLIKTAALIGQARVFYQGRKWNKAIAMYNQIPKDTSFWHNSLIEQSWAYLRLGKFRSALSVLHSLHSDFYEYFYAPELLLLRSTIYLYICKYDEMKKTLDLYKKIYVRLQREIKLYLNHTSDPSTYFVDILKTIQSIKKGDSPSKKYPVSPLLAFKINRDGDFQDALKYIQNLKKERNLLYSMPRRWRTNAVGKYIKKLLDIRITKTHRMVGKIVREKIRNLHTELISLSAQEELIRFEMLNSEKEVVKKIITKEIQQNQKIDEKRKRSFYIQNGYNYWPFKGEYWLDEIGNYYYFGTSSCHQRNLSNEDESS